MNQSDAVKLEKLVKEAISIGKWKGTEGPSYDVFNFNVRLGFLVDEILSVSGVDGKLRELRSSRRMQVVEGVLASLRQKDKFDAASIVEALLYEVETIRKEPVRKYSVAVPIGVSLEIFVQTPQSYSIDGNQAVIFDFIEFTRQYLPKKTINGRQAIDMGALKAPGFDVDKMLIRGPVFLVSEIYARDSWQAAIESRIHIDLFFSLLDLWSGVVPLGNYPLSQCPNPTLCFVFEEPASKPEYFGGWASHDLLPFHFNPFSFSKMVDSMNSIRDTEVWSVIKDSLVAFRRAMSQATAEESLIHFWTACEISVALRNRKIRDDDAAKVMQKIFTGAWYGFPEQAQTILGLRNKILHEGISEVQLHHVSFSYYLFKSLIALLLEYSKKGKNLQDIRTIFEAAKMTEDERKRLL